MTPEALIGSAHFLIWLSTNCCRYSGERRSGATTSTPISLRRATTTGIVMVATAASWSAFTIGTGVFLGKKNASQLSALKLGQALLIHAGEVGQCRRAFLGQNRDRLDSLAFDIADGARGIEAMVVDPARDQVLDRGAASTIRNVRDLEPGRCIESAQARCVAEPVPAEPYCILSALAFP